MPSNSRLKKSAQALAAREGISYTAARRKLLSELPHLVGSAPNSVKGTPSKAQEQDVPKWVMPLLEPCGPVSAAAMKALRKPLDAWIDRLESEVLDEFAGEDWFELTKVQKDAYRLGPRPEWRVERIWLPDTESTEEEQRRYDRGCRTIAGYRFNPRCLDAYVEMAYNAFDPDDLADEYGYADLDVEERAAYLHALDIAAAGVCVLQRSLPSPFRDCLPDVINDNRPAIRVLFAYASLLQVKHPRKARRWMKALVYLDPDDGTGARYCL